MIDSYHRLGIEAYDLFASMVEEFYASIRYCHSGKRSGEMFSVPSAADKLAAAQGFSEDES